MLHVLPRGILAALMKLSAPGKLFLTGEYAVLWGAPATLAAVEPRLHATLTPRDDEAFELRVPGGTSRGVQSKSGIDWTGPVEPSKFVRRAVELARPERGFTLHISAGESGPKGQKLGLGTSASATAIAVAAALGDANPERVFPLAAQAHWEVQGQRGSNGDVAAACFGGVIRYQRWPVEQAERPKPIVDPLDATGFVLALVFSGRSAKTPSMVAAVEAALKPAERAALANESAELTRAFVDALREKRLSRAIEALNASGDWLAKLGTRAGVGVVTKQLAAIQEIGRAHGLAAKVSGAGGGDGALLAGFDARALMAALGELKRNGFEALPVRVSDGLRVS
ncbi:MAG: hypothetical protein JST54_07870 [Deltaproteobacteria bacterium]|nr:hypothetical protein [Deltaproteobacteria bacterium]